MSNSIRILVANDSHLGASENDPLCGMDPFIAFDEAMSIGLKENADMALLGGDLFDTNRPSRSTVCQTIDILRKYCLGDRPVEFQVLSDQKVNFPGRGQVNFEDPNLNIGLPVFSIHGNHDDPFGVGKHAALDILDRAGLVNYFGRVENLEQAEIYPILIQKGTTKVAIYGLGSIRDERLHRMFLHNKVRWIRPEENADEWFNIFVIHQNRYRHSQVYKNCIPDTMLPDFLDLVIWAHEHESLIELEEVAQRRFSISQPGSTCRTSLCVGEAGRKTVGILEIEGRVARMTAVELKLQRPFIIQDIRLEENLDHFNPKDLSSIESFLSASISIMIADSKRMALPLTAPESLRLPQLRIRVHYLEKMEILNTQKFGQKFVGSVANPDSLLIHVKKKRNVAQHKRQISHSLENIDGLMAHQGGISISDLISEFLVKEENLEFFTEKELLKVVEEAVERDSAKSVSCFIQTRIDEIQKHLIEGKIPSEQIHDQVAKLTRKRRAEDEIFQGEAQDSSEGEHIDSDLQELEL